MKKFIFVVLIIFFSSCRKEETTIDIKLPETSVVSSNSRWGVVKYPYIRVRKNPSDKDEVSAAFRQGDIVKILKTTEFLATGDDLDVFWYYTVSGDIEGWVVESDLSIYDSREQATTASKMFKERN